MTQAVADYLTACRKNFRTDVDRHAISNYGEILGLVKAIKDTPWYTGSWTEYINKFWY